MSLIYVKDMCERRGAVSFSVQMSGTFDESVSFETTQGTVHVIKYHYDYTKQIPEILSVVPQHIIVLYTARTDIFERVDRKYHRNIFYEYELRYCPLTHPLVSVHRLATADEIQKLPDMELPILRTDDIISRWGNFTVGDIVAIERTSGVYFRIVK